MSLQSYHVASFVKSVAQLSQLPPDEGLEVAFAGRSNAGKSTALNVLTQQRRLAHTSKMPGRTQLINYFKIEGERHLVDLPGYGYAKVPEEIKLRWQDTLAQYLTVRRSLTGLILVMDSRHPLKEMDQMMIQWAIRGDLPVHILLSKADKLTRSAANQTLMQVKKALGPFGGELSVQLFSALKKQGVEELVAVLDTWYELE